MGWWESILAVVAIWALFAIASELEGIREQISEWGDEE